MFNWFISSSRKGQEIRLSILPKEVWSKSALVRSHQLRSYPSEEFQMRRMRVQVDDQRDARKTRENGASERKAFRMRSVSE